MLIRELLTDLYGPEAIPRIRPGWEWMLNEQHDSLCDNDLMSLAYGLHLHGTPGSILWAWNCHIKNLAAIETATHGNQGTSWGRL